MDRGGDDAAPVRLGPWRCEWRGEGVAFGVSRLPSVSRRLGGRVDATRWGRARSRDGFEVVAAEGAWLGSVLSWRPRSTTARSAAEMV